MILAMIEYENFNFDMKSSTDQFYTIKHNCQIKLKFYEKTLDTLFYPGLKCQGNLSLEIT